MNSIIFSSKCSVRTYQKELLADMETPVSSYFKLNNGGQSFLLESMEGNGSNSRYSFLGFKPMLTFIRTADVTRIEDHTTGQKIELTGDPYEHIRMVLNSFSFDRQAPFECGFLCGYISYDAIRYIEDIPADTRDDLNMPIMHLVIPSEVVIFDNYSHTLKLVVHEIKNGHVSSNSSPDERLASMLERFSQPIPELQKLKRDTSTEPTDIKNNIAKKDYLDSVIRAKEYIRQGDIFQVVLSRRFEKQINCKPFDIYRMLHLINPSPYMYFLNFGNFQIIGSSPETMVRYDGERIVVRPIAGTRWRGNTPQEDKEIATGLLEDQKELAEHMMLVDLGRNDVGRVSRYGTVKLDALKVVENYSHVMHIVSTVSGELDDTHDAVDVFRACFPAGTVSGAPKVRAMEIIDELEQTRRNYYAGAIGYFDFQGRTDTCIAIRTMLVKDSIAYWQAGGGIVSDSDPEYEFRETENKARALLKAITIAEELAHDSDDR
ncbi:anthranilate synthase component I [candidate division KSB1 bacterium]|nr:anthranilate synthase component I [candidate division KSB1 bacterium]